MIRKRERERELLIPSSPRIMNQLSLTLSSSFSSIFIYLLPHSQSLNEVLSILIHSFIHSLIITNLFRKGLKPIIFDSSHIFHSFTFTLLSLSLSILSTFFFLFYLLFLSLPLFFRSLLKRGVARTVEHHF